MKKLFTMVLFVMGITMTQKAQVQVDSTVNVTTNIESPKEHKYVFSF